MDSSQLLESAPTQQRVRVWHLVAAGFVGLLVGGTAVLTVPVDTSGTTLYAIHRDLEYYDHSWTKVAVFLNNSVINTAETCKEVCCATTTPAANSFFTYVYDHPKSKNCWCFGSTAKHAHWPSAVGGKCDAGLLVGGSAVLTAPVNTTGVNLYTIHSGLQYLGGSVATIGPNTVINTAAKCKAVCCKSLVWPLGSTSFTFFAVSASWGGCYCQSSAAEPTTNAMATAGKCDA